MVTDVQISLCRRTELLELELLDLLEWKVNFFFPNFSSLFLLIAVVVLVIWVPDQEILAVMGDGHGLTPTQILKTLEDFVPEDYGLPPY